MLAEPLHAHFVEPVFLMTVAEAPLRLKPFAVNLTYRPRQAVPLYIDIVWRKLLCLHLQFRAKRSICINVDGIGALVQRRVAERAVFAENLTAHFALRAAEIGSFLVVDNAEQRIKRIGPADLMAIEHALGNFHKLP